MRSRFRNQLDGVDPITRLPPRPPPPPTTTRSRGLQVRGVLMITPPPRPGCWNLVGGEGVIFFFLQRLCFIMFIVLYVRQFFLWETHRSHRGGGNLILEGPLRDIVYPRSAKGATQVHVWFHGSYQSPQICFKFFWDGTFFLLQIFTILANLLLLDDFLFFINQESAVVFVCDVKFLGQFPIQP